MNYSVNQAARLVGKSRMTINRAIASGTLSASRLGPGKPWVIDAAELSRVFPVADHVQHDVQHNGQARAGDDHDVLNGELRELRARLADSQDQVADLRRRLDTATAQLGDALTQVRVLTDQRAAAPAAVPSRRWWQWRR